MTGSGVRGSATGGAVGRTPSLRFIVEPESAGIRVDNFLAQHLRTYTSWRMHRMVCAQAVRVNDLPAAADTRVFAGQSVTVSLLEPPDRLTPAESGEIRILWEDPWLAVIDKPAGMVAHPVGRFQSGTLCNILQQHFDEQAVSKGIIRAGIVHRLDRQTSGLLVVAKDQRSHRLLSEDMQSRRLVKVYLALVEGCPRWESRTIELPIGQRPGGGTVLMSARGDARRPRPARTRVRVVRRLKSTSVVECRLDTGRNHQIRVHLAQSGHPVLCDEFYGPDGALRDGADRITHQPSTQRHALHAAELGLRHPILNAWMTFQAAPPADFWDLLGVAAIRPKPAA